MIKNIFGKSLVIGIIVLFIGASVGASVIPTISSRIDDKNKDINVLNNSNTPVVTILEPEEKWAIGNQNISGTASDPDGIVLVQVAIVEEGESPEEDNWVNAEGTTDWLYVWNTYDYIEYYINYDIHARAQNNTGEWGYATPIPVEIDNTPPIIVIIRPYKGSLTFLNSFVIWLQGREEAYVFGGVQVQVYATDPHHSEKTIDEESMIFTWDNNTHTLSWRVPFWIYSWDVPAFGWFSIVAEGKDRAGNLARTDPYSVFYCKLL